MHNGMSVEQFMEWAKLHFKNDNFEFTMYLTKYVKINNENLFNEVVSLLQKDPDKYQLKYLSFAATS